MFAGPIFSREALTSPRQLKHFLIRSGYVAALFVLMYTAMQAMFGWQQVRSFGDVARFGSLVFQIFCIVQLSLVLFFALLFAASGVAQVGQVLCPGPGRLPPGGSSSRSGGTVSFVITAAALRVAARTWSAETFMSTPACVARAPRARGTWRT